MLDMRSSGTSGSALAIKGARIIAFDPQVRLLNKYARDCSKVSAICVNAGLNAAECFLLNEVSFRGKLDAERVKAGMRTPLDSMR
jgi:hypothetical protein